MAQHLSTNTFTVAKFVVSPDKTQGTHTTITSALASASSGDSIYVRDGNYTESFTLVPGVNITALDENVVVIGTITCSATGIVSVINNISVEATAADAIVISGANACNLILKNCFVTSSGGYALNITNSNASSTFYGDTSTFIAGTGHAAFNIAAAAGWLAIFNQCDVKDSGSLVSSTISVGIGSFIYSLIDTPISTSATGQFNAEFSEVGGVANIITGYQPFTFASSNNHALNYTAVTSNSSATSVIALSGANNVNINSCTLVASQPTVISGTGTVGYNLMGIPAGTTIAGTVTLVPKAVRLGAYSILTQVFTTSGTYTPTPGMSSCTIECWGGGGGGGGAASLVSSFTNAGGGGAGSYSRKTTDFTTIGASQTVTIGAAGSGGAAGANNGGNGGDTSVGTICIGKGGTGGTGPNGNANGPGGAGGVAGTGDIAGTGQPGGYGATPVTTATTTNCSGFGGSTSIGGGGAPAAGGQDGFAGTGHGSGGSGGAATATATQAGGNGTAGYVIITEYMG